MDVELDGPVEGREVEGAADLVGRTLHAGDWAGQGMEAPWLGLTDVELNVCKPEVRTQRAGDWTILNQAQPGRAWKPWGLGFTDVGLGGPVEGQHAWMLGRGCRGGAKGCSEGGDWVQIMQHTGNCAAAACAVSHPTRCSHTHTSVGTRNASPAQAT
jgi:hypothetical protein